MSRNQKSKTVLMTGCSSGLGAALALESAYRGLKVIATARTQSDLQKLRESHTLKRGSFKSVDIRMDDCSGFG